jgi:hypothetical protein
MRRAAATLLATLAVLMAGSAGVARAADRDTLGAQLTTSTEWVQVTSQATIETQVTLSILTGSFTLAETSFILEPGQTRQVSYTGTGAGKVMARMAALDASGDAGAIELVGWLGYTPAAPPASPLPLWPFVLLALLLAAGLAGLTITNRARERRRYRMAVEARLVRNVRIF